MRGLARLALLLLATPAAAQSPAVPPVSVYGYEVVRVWPHDRTAFTQGLAWRDGELLESTGRYPSTVRRVRLEDGAVLQRRELEPSLFGEGLTEIDGRVVTLTWRSGRGFVWDADDLEPAGEFAYAGEGWGLTDDGERLILSDGTPTLRFLDPQTFAETGRVTVTLQGRPLLRSTNWSGSTARCSPTSGSRTRSCASIRPRGWSPASSTCPACSGTGAA